MRVNFKQLRGRAGLMPVNNKKVVAAGFTDDNCETFLITFKEDQNGKYRDLLISFESRTPHIYVSESYSDPSEKYLKMKASKRKQREDEEEFHRAINC